MTRFYCLLLGVALLFQSSPATFAQTETNPGEGFVRFAKHTVYYSIFNSTMVQPEVAQVHGITRGGNQMLVNVALVANDSHSGGQAAKVSGNVTNLMQQRRELKFQAIVEDNVTYYLAPLRITNEEVLNFTIDVAPKGTTVPYKVKFSKKLYVDK
jgi:hypothetical protein